MTSNGWSRTVPAPIKITLTGAQETLLATLYGRSEDAAGPQPILGDKWARQVVDNIDYDFAKLGMDAAACVGVAVRASLLDRWTSEFLSTHPSATVLHLACGLDTRGLRVQHGTGVRWIDVDLPDVVSLRRKLIPNPEGDYTLMAASVTKIEEWIDKIPTDRPLIVVLEGLTMYLRPEEGRRLFETIVKRFSGAGGQLVFDAYGTIGIRLQSIVKPVKNTGSTLYWGIDDGKVLEEWCPGLKVVDEFRSCEMPGLQNLAFATRMQLWVMSWVPYLRDFGRMLRYQF